MTMDVLALIEAGSKLLQVVATLVPQIEANVGTIKGAMGETDPAALQAQIAQLHADSLDLTAQLDALKDKAA